jgi:uncharacterized protein YjbJ (UPF0337 family)
MNTLRTRQYWNETKEKLKTKFIQLTDEDLTYSEGKEEVMLFGLQRKLGKTKEELRDILINLNH